MQPLIFANTLRGARVLLASLCAGMLLLQVVISATYSQFSGVLAQMMQQLPPEMAAFMKLQPGAPFAADAYGYLALGYYHPMFLVLGSTLAITLGARAIAGEIDRGTILYLLARPIPRWQVVVSKALSLVPATVAIAAVAVAGTAVGSALTGIQVDAARFALAGINAWALFLALGGVALLLSTVTSSTGAAAGWAGAFALVSFVVDFLADLWDPVRAIEWASVFNLYDPSSIITTGQLNWGPVVILLAVACVAVVVGALRFERRDIA